MSRIATANRMKAFYEPAYFGSSSGYGQAFNDWAGNFPTQMGGFSLGPEEREGFNANMDQLGGGSGYGGAIRGALRARNAYDQPPVGPQNLANYGVGQLQNSGVGALDAYRPLAREEDLRWRR